MNTLQALKPVSLVPSDRSPDAPCVTVALSHIACVRVRLSRTGDYTIEMYSKTPSSSARTNLQDQELQTNNLSPSKRIERSYADFLKLQTQLVHRVQTTHRSVPCSFCYEVSSAAAWGGTQVSPLAMLAMTENELADIFTTFFNEILAATRAQHVHARRQGPCLAQECVPLMLCEFLTHE